jgi:hypothetical protein
MQNFNEFTKTNNDYKNIKDLKHSTRNSIYELPYNTAINTEDATNPTFGRSRQEFVSKNNNINEYANTRWNNANTIGGAIADVHKYRITRVNIDSSYRNTIPKNILSNNIRSFTNPFSFTRNLNIINVHMIDHGLSINDKIVISNVIGDEFYLKKFDFTHDSQYVKIYHINHGMLPFDKSKIYAPYQIKIDNITQNGLTFIQNIPLNMLNDYHTVYFNIDGGDTYNKDYYFIKLPLATKFDKTVDTHFKVTYLHLYGIPISYINANFPITADSAKGYHNVFSIIDQNNFTIVTDYVANTTIDKRGGNNICIDKIVDYIEGYPNNNNYIISLHKTFYNVSKIRLLSTEFPNTEKIIKSAPSPKQNNSLFWQIIDDGDHMYNINLTAGNYNIKGIISELTNEIQATKRAVNSSVKNTATYEYSSLLDVTITINENTSEFTISFFGTIKIENPFKISKITVDDSVRYVMEVFHPNHLLNNGTSILIQNSTNIGEVPASVINTVQIINNIIDENNYVINLAKFNTINTQEVISSGGGVAIQIKYPLQARLFFDRANTIGTVLGFRNVGSYNSVTSWAYNISNRTPYSNDILVDAVGKPISKEINNYINLNGDSYILMTNSLFKNTVNTGTVNGIFAKILLAGPPGSILYNQYIQLGEEITEGVQSLSELEFAFYSPDGILYDFNNIDHAFTIEIYEKIISHEKLNQNSKQG